VCLALLALLVTFRATAQTTFYGPYSVEGNFSASSNPSGVWNYGYRLGFNGGFILYTVKDSRYGSSSNLWSQGSLPYVLDNTSSSELAYETVRVPQNMLNLHPGPNGERSTVRWRAPVAGTVRIQGRFQGLDVNGTTTDTAIRQISPFGQTSLHSGQVNGFGASATFDFEVSVQASDLIEFSVGPGSNNTYYSDSTGVLATIAFVIPNANAVVDFSQDSNTSGSWRFGTYTFTGQFSPFPYFEPGTAAQDLPTWTTEPGGLPYVKQNRTGSFRPYLSTILSPHTLSLHPGPNGARSVVRWVASLSGTVTVDGFFDGLDVGGTTTDVFIDQRSAADAYLMSHFSGTIRAFGDRRHFHFVATVTQGDFIDLVVSPGPSGNYSSDSTGLAVTINPVRDDRSLNDAKADFSALSNPTGAWSYGSRASPNAPFTVYPVHRSTYGASLPMWSLGSHPYVLSNTSSVAQTYETVSIPPDVLGLHPGANGERSIVRWTAAHDGLMRVKGYFMGIDTGGTTTDVTITHNGAAQLFSARVNGSGSNSRVNFSFTRQVAAGNVLEFSVGHGGNGYANDSTALSASILPASSSTFTRSGLLYTTDARGKDLTGNNPGGAWVFGSRAGSAGFVPFTVSDVRYGSRMLMWAATNGGFPYVGRNTTNVSQSAQTFTLPPDLLNLHPGPNGELSVVRWTAPLGGMIHLEGHFKGLDPGTSTAVSLKHNGVELLASSGRSITGNTGAAANSPFSLDQTVLPGDVIEFSVGMGPNGYFGDSTGLVATVSYPSIVGLWTKVPSWQPFIAIHSSVLPDGNVLMMSRRAANGGYLDSASGRTQVRLWDPRTGSFLTVGAPPNSPLSADPQVDQERCSHTSVNDVFCSGHSFLPDGRLLVAGGTYNAGNCGSEKTNIFNFVDRTWTQVTSANSSRWYPTNCTLPNGEVLVVPTEAFTKNADGTQGPAPTVQVWMTGGGWRNLSTPSQILQHNEIYNWLHVAPNGHVFSSGPGVGRFLDWTTGTWAQNGIAGTLTDRNYGSSVMYEPGKVMVSGGGGPTPTAETIDLTASTPAWQVTQPMMHARRHHNASLLPNGQTLVTGGSIGPGYESFAPALPAEVWDSRGSWSTLASLSTPRLYHSTAVLLPDGRILSAGGGAGGAPNVPSQFSADTYKPPYFFRGSRPVITSAPGRDTSIAYGSLFFVGTPDVASIERVSLVRLPSVTHGFDQNTRFNQLTFSKTIEGLSITAPSSPNLAPPGHYMLFILKRDAAYVNEVFPDGVPSEAFIPSEATIIRLQ
jgi:hypothetical protein